MRVGVTLPQFLEDAEPAIAAARRAEELGLDGVFVFDHLWPIGQPDKPVLPAVPLLGALAVETRRVWLASFVARVGLKPDAVLVHELASVARMAPRRFIAGLGTGDRMSAAENLAFGVSFPPAAERRESLRRCCRDLGGLGVPTWVGVGAGSAATRAVAVEVDAPSAVKEVGLRTRVTVVAGPAVSVSLAVPEWALLVAVIVSTSAVLDAVIVFLQGGVDDLLQPDVAPLAVGDVRREHRLRSARFPTRRKSYFLTSQTNGMNSAGATLGASFSFQSEVLLLQLFMTSAWGNAKRATIALDRIQWILLSCRHHAYVRQLACEKRWICNSIADPKFCRCTNPYA